MKKVHYIVYPRLNPFCNRIAYFVIDDSLDYRYMSIAELYNQCDGASFIEKVARHRCIKMNLENR